MLAPLLKPATEAEAAWGVPLDLSLTPAASSTPPQTPLPDAASSLFGLLFDAELPEGEEGQSEPQSVAEADLQDKRPQGFLPWPGLTPLEPARSVVPAVAEDPEAADQGRNMRIPAQEQREGQGPLMKVGWPTFASGGRGTTVAPLLSSPAGCPSFAPAGTTAPAPELGLNPSEPLSTDAVQAGSGVEPSTTKPEAGGPILQACGSAEAVHAHRESREPERNRGPLGSQGQPDVIESGDLPVFESPSSAGQPQDTKRLEARSPQARSEESKHSAIGGEQRRLASPEETHPAHLGRAAGEKQQDGLYTGTPEAQLAEPRVRYEQGNARGWARTNISTPIPGISTDAETNTAGSEQTREGLTHRNGPEPTIGNAPELEAHWTEQPEGHRAGQGRIPGSLPQHAGDLAAPAVPQPVQTPAAPELGASQEPEQPVVQSNQVAAVSLRSTEASPWPHPGPVSTNGSSQSRLVRAGGVPPPDPTADGNSPATAAERWSRLPERAARAALWSSEVAFAARLAEPAQTAPSNPGARSMTMPDAQQRMEPAVEQEFPGVTAGMPDRGSRSSGGSEIHVHKTSPDLDRTQATQLLEKEERVPSPGEAVMQTRSALADEPVPASRRQAGHTKETVETQPVMASSRLVAGWGGTGAATWQEPGAKTAEAAGRTEAKSLSAAASGADPADRHVHGQTSSAVRELRVRLADAGVEVRLAPAGRELHVAVRSPQPELREALRGGLDELAARLAEHGLEAQIWRPAQAPPPGAAERGWEASRSPVFEGGEAGAGRRGQPDQQPPGDGERRQPDPRWAEVWSEREGEAPPRPWGWRR